MKGREGKSLSFAWNGALTSLQFLQALKDLGRYFAAVELLGFVDFNVGLISLHSYLMGKSAPVGVGNRLG